MIIKILGIMDLLSSIAFLLLQFNIYPYRFIIAVILYLGIKGYVFRSNINSLIDFTFSIILLFSLIGLRNWLISFICAIYLGQKAIASLF